MRAAQKSPALPQPRQLGASLQSRPDTAQAQQWAPPTQIDVSSPTNAPASVGYQARQPLGAQDTWFDIEDLLLRLAAHCRVQINPQEDHLELTFLGFNAGTRGGRLSDVAVRVIDLDTYAWQSVGPESEGSQGNFISDLEFQGADLCLRFKPLARIKRWEEGESIAWQVKTFLLRLQALHSPINPTV